VDEARGGVVEARLVPDQHQQVHQPLELAHEVGEVLARVQRRERALERAQKL
jgi:hypothetical protein